MPAYSRARSRPRTAMDVYVCVITGAGCIHEQNGCIIGNVHDTVLSVGVFFFLPACCPDSNYRGFSGEVRQPSRRRRLCTAWFCQLTGCSVCGTGRQPRIPGVRLGETQGLVISTNFNQKPKTVSCHTLFVIFDTLPLLRPRPANKNPACLHTHTHKSPEIKKKNTHKQST